MVVYRVGDKKIPGQECTTPASDVTKAPASSMGKGSMLTVAVR